MAEKAKPGLHQECWQLMVVLHTAQTGGGVPGSNWEEKEGMGWGDWDYSLSSPRSSTRITREGRKYGGDEAGWLDNRAGAFALKEREKREEGKKLSKPATTEREDLKSQGKNNN